MKILCPFCGKKTILGISKYNNGEPYKIECTTCGRFIYCPSHPLIDIGIDFTKDTLNYAGKLRNIWNLGKFLTKKNDD